MVSAGEKMAEHSHLIWAKKASLRPCYIHGRGLTLVHRSEKERDHTNVLFEAFKIWNDLNTKGGFMPTALVPWDLLTDFERRKDRFRATEILKFLQYHGYHVERCAFTMLLVAHS